MALSIVIVLLTVAGLSAQNSEETYFSDDVELVDTSCEIEPEEGTTLILSHVIFRHGNRTPDSVSELYPNDPYLNYTFHPYGWGQLTNAGKQKEFDVGTTLRERYSNFLGDVFLPTEVEARTTDYNRTKASLQLVLAGLYPPKEEQIWNPQLAWQPIPYNYLPRSEDRILMGHLCPNFVDMYQNQQMNWKRLQKYRKYYKYFNYISRFSGLNVTTFNDVYNLYFGLSTEEELGLPLPTWTQKVWPKIVTQLAMLEYFFLTAQDDMKRMASGYLLEKIIQDTIQKISECNSEKKIFLYSAHENNLAQFLILLGVFDTIVPRHVPNYGAHILVEIHKINGEFGVMVYYQNWETELPALIPIPNCGNFCSFDNFVNIYSKYLPESGLCETESNEI